MIEGAIESRDVEGMNTKEQPIASLAAKIENLIQEHVEATRRAAADALERVLSGKERASICVPATTKTPLCVKMFPDKYFSISQTRVSPLCCGRFAGIRVRRADGDGLA